MNPNTGRMALSPRANEHPAQATGADADECVGRRRTADVTR